MAACLAEHVSHLCLPWPCLAAAVEQPYRLLALKEAQAARAVALLARPLVAEGAPWA